MSEFRVDIITDLEEEVSVIIEADDYTCRLVVDGVVIF